MTRNILVTNFDDRGEDVMIFTETLTIEKVIAKLAVAGNTYDDIYEVPKSDLSYYIYDPCWIEE